MMLSSSTIRTEGRSPPALMGDNRSKRRARGKRPQISELAAFSRSGRRNSSAERPGNEHPPGSRGLQTPPGHAPDFEPQPAQADEHDGEQRVGEQEPSPVVEGEPEP